ncbi:MAG: hypothetical protein HIU89_03435 [Proteobacteria bacterium]|nr:hypothetical protein [Pseudomonadota bacterium]
MHAAARSLAERTDEQLLDVAIALESMVERTPLEVELLWRLAEAQHINELARAEQRRILAELWATGPTPACE